MTDPLPPRLHVEATPPALPPAPAYTPLAPLLVYDSVASDHPHSSPSVSSQEEGQGEEGEGEEKSALPLPSSAYASVWDTQDEAIAFHSKWRSQGVRALKREW